MKAENSRNCANCNTVLLKDETQCWQCGWLANAGIQLPNSSNNETALSASNFTPLPMPALTLYGSLTLLLIILALLTLGQLGQQPRLQNESVEWKDGWQPVDSANHTFLLNLPDDWVWLDGMNLDQARIMNTRAATMPEWLAGVAPIALSFIDGELIFLAEPGAQSELVTGMFVVGWQSEALSQLSANDMLTLAIDSEMPLAEGQFYNDFDKSHVRLDVLKMETKRGLRCRQNITIGGEQSMIFAFCAPDPFFRTHDDIVERVLGSFQRLEIGN